MKFFEGPIERNSSFYYREHLNTPKTVPAFKTKMHIHQSAELLYVINGKIMLHINGKENEIINSGCAALLFPFQSHEYNRDEGTEYVRFNFDTELTKDFFLSCADLVGENSVFRISEATEFQLQKRFFENKDLTRLSIQSMLYSALSDFSAQATLTERCADDDVLTNAILYMRSHKTEPLKIDDVAKAISYSTSHLSYSINRAAGFGFNTLLSMLRIEDARALLRDTQKSVLEIALECGFGSERSFYRQFKALIGQSPNEYRIQRTFNPTKDPYGYSKRPFYNMPRKKEGN